MASDDPQREVHGPPAPLLLRPYARQDFPELLALDRACFPPGIAYSEAELHYFLRHPRCFAIVAQAGQQIVAFILAERTMEAGRPAGHLITIDVAQDARRLGLGSRLIAAVEQRLREGGSVLLSLEVAINNEPAQRFYTRHGFALTGRIPGYYAGNLDALTMAKPLLP